MTGYRHYLVAAARVLMASLFLWEGWQQLRNPGGTATYIATLGVPESLATLGAWVSIAIHWLSGLALLVGWQTRWAAAVLALFCLGTAFGVHLPAGDSANMVHFYKNLALTGGYAYIIAFGAGAISIDGGKTA